MVSRAVRDKGLNIMKSGEDKFGKMSKGKTVVSQGGQTIKKKERESTKSE